MDALVKLVETVNAFSPLGVIGLLSYIVYLLVAKKGPVKQITENHLHEMPEIAQALRELVQSSDRQERLLGDILGGINFLRGREDRRSR